MKRLWLRATLILSFAFMAGCVSLEDYKPLYEVEPEEEEIEEVIPDKQKGFNVHSL